MAATGKLMSVMEKQALVVRERNLYKINAEDWELNKPMEVETHMKESHVSEKFIWFGVDNGKLVGMLQLFLARGVDPGTVVARFAMAVRRRGAAAVTRLADELWSELITLPNLSNHPANNGGRVMQSKEVFLEAYTEGVYWKHIQEAFLKEHLVDAQLLVEVDLEVAVRREQLGKARVRRETFF